MLANFPYLKSSPFRKS